MRWAVDTPLVGQGALRRPMRKGSCLALAFSLLVLLAAVSAAAQPAPKAVRVGFLSSNPKTAGSMRWLDALREGLRERGWEEGRNLVLEPRWADGHYDQLDDLTAELVRLGVDAIVTDSTPSALAAKRATQTIPIVLGLAGDPVRAGLVVSLSRPGGNVTGMSLMSPELSGKRLELLKEIVPEVKRVAVILRQDNPVHGIFWSEAQGAAGKLSLTLRSFNIRTATDLDGMLPAVAAWRANALLVFGDVLLESAPYRGRIVAFQLRRKIPAIGVARELTEAGFLMSFGASYAETFRQAAAFVDKILRGAKPGELPVEQARQFELVINLKTAEAIGLTIPQSVLVRADWLIQ